MASADKPELHIGHRKRIKERYLERGLLSLDDKDILELILTYAIPRKDVYGTARELVFEFGSVEGVLEAGIDELISRGKLSEHTAVLIKLINDIKSTPYLFISFRHEQLTNVLKTAEYCHELLEKFGEEIVIEIFLSDDDTVTDVTKVSFGSGDTALLPVDSILAQALRHGVKKVIVAHNHPSGSSHPSVADISATDAVTDALRSHGITLAEHVIVAGNECTAMLHHQTIPMQKRGAFALWKDARDE